MSALSRTWLRPLQLVHGIEDVPPDQHARRVVQTRKFVDAESRLHRCVGTMAVDKEPSGSPDIDVFHKQAISAPKPVTYREASYRLVGLGVGHVAWQAVTDAGLGIWLEVGGRGVTRVQQLDEALDGRFYLRPRPAAYGQGEGFRRDELTKAHGFFPATELEGHRMPKRLTER